jgi:hypothetical protein
LSAPAGALSIITPDNSIRAVCLTPLDVTGSENEFIALIPTAVDTRIYKIMKDLKNHPDSLDFRCSDNSAETTSFSQLFFVFILLFRSIV